MTGSDTDEAIVFRSHLGTKIFAAILFGGPLIFFFCFLWLVVRGGIEGSLFSAVVVVLMFSVAAAFYIFGLGESFSQRLEITKSSVAFHSLFRTVTMQLKDIDLIVRYSRNSRAPSVVIRGAGKVIVFLASGSPDAVVQALRDTVFGRAVAAGAHVRTALPLANPIPMRIVPVIAMSYVFGIFAIIGLIVWLHATR